MKQCWLNLTNWNKKLVTEALESGIDAIVSPPEYIPYIKELGRITIVSTDGGDLSIPSDVEIITIHDKKDEQSAALSLKSRTVVVRTTDWDIIPIENLIPVGGERLFTFVNGLDQARLATGIMEKGVAGIVLETSDPSEITRVTELVRRMGAEKLELENLKITRVQTIGIGDRVCVDTCSNISPGQGLLVGNSSQGLFLVHAENIENPYVAPRPFRVNAGSVHSYVRVPGDRTRYLGELSTGDPVLITGAGGSTDISYVGRSKIEKRPMLVIFACDNTGKEYSVVLQNAETIRLTAPDGSPVSVVKLAEGDMVLGHTEKGGRHFGMAVEETITER